MTRARLRRNALQAVTHGSRAEVDSAVNAYVASVRASMGPNRAQRVVRWWVRTPAHRYTVGWADDHPRAAWVASGALAAVELAAFLAFR